MLDESLIRSTAICYASDPGFLFPTLCSIASLREKLGPQSAAQLRLFYFTLDFESDHLAAAEAALMPMGVKLITMDSAKVRDFDVSLFNKTHVTFASMARLFMDELLPDDVDRIFYVDGDTLFDDDPTELLNWRPPANTIGAADDQSYYYQFEYGPTGDRVRAYLAGLGLPEESPYFNAGILMADRAAWRSVAAEAFAFFRENTAACRYHDQSCMNAVIGDRRVYISPRWNFQSPFRKWSVEERVGPKLFHFLGGPKPWSGVVAPWESVAGVFDGYAEGFPAVGRYRQMISGEDQERANAMNRKDYMKLRTIFAPRLLARQRRIRENVEKALI